MNGITCASELKESIRILEIKQANDEVLLKEQFKTTYESLKPINLIKNTLQDLTTAPDLKGDLLNATMSLTAGFLSKKVAVGSSHNPLKQLLGTILQMGVTSIVAKNAEGIKSVGSTLITHFLSKKNI